jgi:hypothetical protein
LLTDYGALVKACFSAFGGFIARLLDLDDWLLMQCCGVYGIRNAIQEIIGSPIGFVRSNIAFNAGLFSGLSGCFVRSPVVLISKYRVGRSGKICNPCSSISLLP